MTNERWSEMMKDPAWDDVARGQAMAWKILKTLREKDPNLTVEDMPRWQSARELAAQIEKRYAE